MSDPTPTQSAPQRPHDSPPWRDDPPAVRQFDADVARARKLLTQATELGEWRSNARP